MEMNTGMMKANKRAGACNAEAAEPSQWERKRLMRHERFWRSKLVAASADLVKSTPNAARWFCMIVVDGAEMSVERRLIDGGVEVLVPKHKADKVIKGKAGKPDRKISIEKASFTGYVFVHIVPSPEAFTRLKTVKGVMDFLHCGEQYHVVPDGHLAFYLGEHVDRMKTDKSIGDGCSVHIHSGPFAGYDAVVLQVISPKSRSPEARVWAKSFAREIKMPVAFLEKL
ncbi:transcription termination/antitermination protein NusG [Rhizobium panacihumi]|uniref:transcription termination/antitermination protein NusG n=1 Tax=Rhizobium panacihumi TaxID=2008450 RepID=UPI003D7AC7DA